MYKTKYFPRHGLFTNMSNSQSTIKAVTMDMCKTAKEMSPESFSELVIHSGNEDSSEGHCTLYRST